MMEIYEMVTRQLDKLISDSVASETSAALKSCIPPLAREVESLCPVAMGWKDGQLHTAYGPTGIGDYVAVILSTERSAVSLKIAKDEMVRAFADVRAAIEKHQTPTPSELWREISVAIAENDIQRALFFFCARSVDSEEVLWSEVDRIRSDGFTPILVGLSFHDEANNTACGTITVLVLPSELEVQLGGFA